MFLKKIKEIFEVSEKNIIGKNIFEVVLNESLEDVDTARKLLLKNEDWKSKASFNVN